MHDKNVKQKRKENSSLSARKKCRLALYGGTPVREKPMPSRLAFGSNELKAVKKLFEYYKKQKRDFGYQDEFERIYCEAFVNYMGVKGFSDAVNSGTSALYVSLAALNLKPNSHVLVSPVTDPGTISAIILNNLVPVLTDSIPQSYNIGTDEFQERISEKIKAAVIIHIGGKPAAIDGICDIAKEKGIRIIEDCSQSHGAKLKEKKVGTFGDIAAFSTMYRKIHATGGCGGVVFTRKKRYYDFIKAYADRGKPFFRPDFNEKDPSSFLFPALNLNIDEVSCAIGTESLKKLDSTIKKRIKFLKKLDKKIAKESKVCHLMEVSEDDSPFFHPVIVDVSKISCSKNEFANAVRAEGIDINPEYKYVVSEWKWVKPYLADSFISRMAVNFRKSSFNLLLNENYGEEEIKDIVDVILKVEKTYTL